MISPVIQFHGQCLEAINFYEKVFSGTNKHIEFYKEAPADLRFSTASEFKNWVMNAGIIIAGTYVNMNDT